MVLQVLPIQLPRVIEGGVWINDSREFEFPPVRHWQPVGGGVHTRVKWCEPHFALVWTPPLNEQKGGPPLSIPPPPGGNPSITMEAMISAAVIIYVLTIICHHHCLSMVIVDQSIAWPLHQPLCYIEYWFLILGEMRSREWRKLTATVLLGG